MQVRLPNEIKEKTYETPAEFAKLMRFILLRENKLRRTQEHFWIIALNPKSNIVLIELIALGAHNRVVIPPVDVLRLAVYKNSTQVILAHNHPSGRLKPSELDIDLTNRLLKAGWLLGLKVIDHLVIAEKGFFSFAKKGIMERLNKSKAWTLVQEKSADQKELERQMDIAQGEFDKSLSIAKKMKAKGMSSEIIKELTGLSLRKIKKL